VRAVAQVLLGVVDEVDVHDVVPCVQDEVGEAEEDVARVDEFVPAAAATDGGQFTEET
jgi:hypothetical protein